MIGNARMPSSLRISMAIWTALAVACLSCAACSSWGKSSDSPSKNDLEKTGSGWRPASIDNHALEVGQKSISAGHDYNGIATRAEDPQPLSAQEISKIFPLKAVQLSPNCSTAVMGSAIVSSLAEGGCRQVLRAIATSFDNSGGHATSLIEIFNLKSGDAVYKASGMFGQKSAYGDVPASGTSRVPDFPSKGFIRSWPGTAAADVAASPNNAAEVDGFGHFLVVIWTFGETNSIIGNDGASSLFDDALSKFASNRELSSS